MTFRAAATARANASSVIIGTPAGTTAGDGLLLFVSAASSSVTLSTPTGWTRESRVADSSMQTVLYSRAASSTSPVTVTASAAAKLDAQMLAYAGTDGTDPVQTALGVSEPGTRAEHTAPALPATDTWTVSYWADKTSATTGWTPPGSVTQRAQSIGTGSGRITSLSADSGGPGGNDARAAVASSSASKATMWSVALREPGGAPPPPPTGVVRWDMNEPAGATVMVPTAGGLSGTIGSEVETGIPFGGATGYRFPYLAPNTPPPHPAHLVRVEDNTALDPGTSDFTVTIRMQATRRFGNVIQKGQAAADGGQWKLQMPNGVMECLFRDRTGVVRGVSSGTPVNDGAWHVISCSRTSNSVSLFVDGVRKDTRTGPLGSVDNARPVTIAGKPDCDQIKVTCDYFVGMVDWVEITKE